MIFNDFIQMICYIENSTTVTRQYYNETNMCYPNNLIKETNIDIYTCSSSSE